MGRLAERFSFRPSQLMGILDTSVAYDLDEAVRLRLMYRDMQEAEWRDTAMKKAAKEAARKAKAKGGRHGE
jgi:hypothetical protein